MANGTSASNGNATVSPSQPSRIPDTTLDAWFGVTITVSLTSSVLILLLMKIIYSSDKTGSGVKKLTLHLLLINFLLCAFSNPIYVVSTYMALHKIPVYLDCTAVMFVRIVEIGLQDCAELCLAVNRFVAITFPTRYKWWSQNSVAWAMILITWMMAMVPMIPTLFGYGMAYGAFAPLHSCTGRPLTSDLVFPVATGVGVFFPMAAVGTIYVTILVVLRFRKQMESKQTRRKAKIALMLFVAYLMNLVCYIPMSIMVTNFPKIAFGSPTMLLWLVALQVIGYGANPAAFFGMNENYRTAAARFFTRRTVAPTGTGGDPSERASNFTEHRPEKEETSS